MGWNKRNLLAAAAAGAMLVAAAPAAQAATPQLLLVHGHGNPADGKNCNGATWDEAIDYYTSDGSLSRDEITTVAYYEGNGPGGPNVGNCDVQVSAASKETKIQFIARDLANYVHDEYTSKGEPVNIAAHSMGGLVTRVALLGTAEGWSGFPPSMDVDNVATAGTPHQGVKEDRDDYTAQWDQMEQGSGFLDALHADGRELGDAWTDGTDWTVIGSAEDGVVSYDSAIDKGNRADQKFGYLSHDAGTAAVTHSGIREITGPHTYEMHYWHDSGDHDTHHTDNGWAPLKSLYKAALYDGDDLPR
ncbi:hypothetical protein [Prauserella alba]|uniref:DUF676 domain-containing protein n=1 Tax=Prauserella alba TaxID=176898 RepID=A0ABN1V7U1_9PSEU|nr:hypothetical protein [Prauserella alba]MCP2181383.1 Triacylglycerol esterase/lipase EstA, alpha/beta hydrolase fold [Prauserella alba]